MDYDPNLVTVAERSAFLYERLGSRLFCEQPGNGPDDSLSKILEHWSNQACRGDGAAFQKRLAWDGLASKAVTEIVKGVQVCSSNRLAGWTDFTRAALERCSQFQGRSTEELETRASYLRQKNPVPFEHLFIPFIDHSSGRVEAVAGPTKDVLTTAAWNDLQRHLLRRLAAVAEETLYLEFSVWRSLPDTRYLGGSIRLTGPGRELYDAYLQYIWDGGAKKLFLEYPVLARLLGRISELWVSFISQFLSHVRSDVSALESFLNRGKSLGKVAGIVTDLSEPHENGKSVFRVKFESGFSCFYKPRNVRSEEAYNQLLTWLNEHGLPLHLHTYKILARGDHGWVEEVTNSACTEEQQVRRYFHRIGMLISLLYALEANDCNCQNIIALGEHPVIIDTETLLQPRPRIPDSNPWGGAMQAANQALFSDSVFRVGILPRWIASPSGEKFDISGLGAVDGRRGVRREKVRHGINTDAMSMQWETVSNPSGPHEVSLAEKPINPANYVDEITDGFSQMYRFLIDHRGALWTADGPLHAMNRLPVRFLFRNTSTYAGILQQCLKPAHLEDGMMTSTCVEPLARHFLVSETRPHDWPILSAEHNSILQGDIPRFTAFTDKDDLFIGEKVLVNGFFGETSMALLRSRFEKLSQDDCDLQVRYIRCSFAEITGESDAAEVSVTSTETTKNGASISEDLLAEAREIAARIREKTIYATDGGASWITQIYNPDSQFWQLQPMRRDFYDGVGGTVLFLAALEHVTGNAENHDLMLAALQGLTRLSPEQVRYWLDRDGIGAGVGASSVIYALARVSIFVKDRRLFELALKIAEMLGPERIASDERLDLVGGSAGCLLVYRMLYRLDPQPWMMERIIQCGEHLLEARRNTDTGLRAWPTVKGSFLAGFAHGAAGIIYSLCQAYELTSDERFLRAALEAQTYENTLFDERKKNWPNLLVPARTGGFEFWNSWCHGAPGIGLGRLGSRDWLPHGGDDLKYAVDTTANGPLSHMDSLCCGNLGRLELLLQSASRLKDVQQEQQAHEYGMRIVRRAKEKGRFGIGIKNGVYIPSFHQGMAGVGYELLRLAKPDLPCVLMWE